MEFPRELQDAMKDCIFKLIWPKDEMISFFKACGCNTKDLKAIGNYKETSREKILFKMFKGLSKRSDKGKKQFEEMLDKLMKWTKFDPFFFDELGKLNKEDALEAIELVKQEVEFAQTGE